MPIFTKQTARWFDNGPDSDLILTCWCAWGEKAHFSHHTDTEDWEGGNPRDGLAVRVDVEDEGDAEQPHIHPRLFSLTIEAHPKYWSDRLRHIWAILTSQRYTYGDEVLVSEDDARALIAWLNRRMTLR